MYILLNFSKKSDCFNLYINCLNSLIKNNELAYIDLCKEIEDINMDFETARRKVEAALSNASASKFSFIILYDFEMQKREPMVYSITAILNNIKNQIIHPIRTNYAIDKTYFLTLDDIGRGVNGEIVDENLKKNIEFDKKGYIDEIDKEQYVSLKDIDFINDGLKESIKNSTKKGIVDINKLIKEFDKKYLSVIENRIYKAIDNDIPINDNWYGEQIKKTFIGYKDELKDFFDKVNKSEKNLSDMSFSIKDYLQSNIASYTDINNHKILRLNMLDKEGHSRRDETKYKNYYKIIAIIIYLVTEDKKFLFGGAYIKEENHYFVDVDIENKTIENMLNDYLNNINFEMDKLGQTKFAEIEIEDFEKSKIDSSIFDNKIYEIKKVKFSLLKNENDVKKTYDYVEHWKKRYLDQVNHCNKRLRNVSDELRVKMLKDFTGKKSAVTVNQLYQIKEQKEARIKEIKEIVAKNTPEDIIQLDYSIFDKNDEIMAKANDELNKRISLMHFIFNILFIFGISIVIFPILRRFTGELFVVLTKFAIYITPVIIYIILQLLFCFLKIRKTNKYLYDIEKYTRGKIDDINVDDNKFSVYINNIYELMLLTKYMNKLNSNASNAQDDINNFMYHKHELEDSIEEGIKIVKLMRMKINPESRVLKNIALDITRSHLDNDLYCPLFYVEENKDNYIYINNSHKENLVNKLLNFVDSITINNDEVYNEWN